MPAPNVKVCGLTRLEDAQLAHELGAWALSMIFWKGTLRRCKPLQPPPASGPAPMPSPANDGD